MLRVLQVDETSFLYKSYTLYLCACEYNIIIAYSLQSYTVEQAKRGGTTERAHITWVCVLFI